ncbi:MAG TPA: L,D-transpeptidase [Polyangiaceae bacterium]
MNPVAFESRRPHWAAPRLRARAALLLGLAAFVAAPGCRKRAKADGTAKTAATGVASAEPTAVTAPISSLHVDHGELDTRAPTDAPRLAATIIATTIYKLPDLNARKLGYLRLGAVVQRDADAVPGKGCKGAWYRIYPMGYVCTDEATLDVNDPLVRAASVRPDLSKPLPYRYGFVRATAPQYLRVPTRAEQDKSEFKLDEHLDWFKQNHDEVQRVVIGANDVALDPRGLPALKPNGRAGKPSTELSTGELFGGKTADDPRPFWLDGGRKIPNVSGYEVPDYALFADRVRRKTGLSFVGSFEARDGEFSRRFAVTVDLRLIPTSKVKPDTGSPFHGVELGSALRMPFAWVIKRDSKTYKLIKDKDEARPAEDVPRRALIPLTGKARIKGGVRYYQSTKDQTRWLRADDLGIVAEPPEWPAPASKGEKWISISLRQQTLVLYEGKRPFYATLVATGRDRLGDPKTSLATPQGDFRLRSKHIAAAMDSYENSAVSGGTRANTNATSEGSAADTIARLKKAQTSGQTLDEDDRRRLLNIEKGRDPEYGVTKRRGSENFELRDVPWIQYFAAGYALHGAYWHDVFGIPRSHGCVNLSPIDARIVFNWTDPPVPAGWHGINVGPDMGEGTAVIIRE